MNQRTLPAWLWAAVVCLLLAHNVYLWIGQRLAPDSDILALLPVEERDPVLQNAFSKMVESAQQRLIVLVGAGDWVEAGRAADNYLAVLAPHKNLLQADEQIAQQPQQDWLALFQQHRLVLVTPGDEAALRSQAKPYWVDTALAKLYSPFGGVKPGAWGDDPFGLFGGWIQARMRETPVRPRDGRLFVSDGKRQYVVLPFSLRVSAFSMAAQEALVPLLEQARQAARQSDPQVEVAAAGVILYAAAAGAQAKWEVSIIGIGSLLGIVALIWLTFYSLKPIVLIMVSIGVGCLGALSMCWLLFERIHLLTLVFGASLIGGAQDYGTYFLCHRLGADRQSLDSYQLLRRLLPALALALVHDRNWLPGTRLDAVSGSAADGGVLRAGSNIRMAHRGFLVSRAGEPRHSEKRAAGPLVLRQSAALAVVALDPIDLVGGRAVDRVHCFRGVAPDGSG